MKPHPETLPANHRLYTIRGVTPAAYAANYYDSSRMSALDLRLVMRHHPHRELMANFLTQDTETSMTTEPTQRSTAPSETQQGGTTCSIVAIQQESDDSSMWQTQPQTLRAGSAPSTGTSSTLTVALHPPDTRTDSQRPSSVTSPVQEPTQDMSRETATSTIAAPALVRQQRFVFRRTSDNGPSIQASQRLHDGHVARRCSQRLTPHENVSDRRGRRGEGVLRGRPSISRRGRGTRGRARKVGPTVTFQDEQSQREPGLQYPASRVTRSRLRLRKEGDEDTGEAHVSQRKKKRLEGDDGPSVRSPNMAFFESPSPAMASTVSSRELVPQTDSDGGSSSSSTIKLSGPNSTDKVPASTTDESTIVTTESEDNTSVPPESGHSTVSDIVSVAGVPDDRRHQGDFSFVTSSAEEHMLFSAQLSKSE